MILGYILDNSEEGLELDDQYIKRISSLSEYSEDKPLLIVGWDMVSRLDAKADILNKKLKPNMYWTFSLEERRYEALSDIQNFSKLIRDKLIDDIEYLYIDPLCMKITQLKKIISRLKSKDIIVSDTVAMIYIYDGEFLFGLNKAIAKYCGVDIDKLMIRLRTSNTVRFATLDHVYDKDLKKYGEKYAPVVAFNEEQLIFI